MLRPAGRLELTSGWIRKALVTGSIAGIGRAVAEGLARAGAAVVINIAARSGSLQRFAICASFSRKLNSPASSLGHAAVFLMTNPYVTGTVIKVSGGELLVDWVF
jgi:hypothetical protein